MKYCSSAYYIAATPNKLSRGCNKRTPLKRSETSASKISQCSSTHSLSFPTRSRVSVETDRQDQNLGIVTNITVSTPVALPAESANKSYLISSPLSPHDTAPSSRPKMLGLKRLSSSLLSGTRSYATSGYATTTKNLLINSDTKVIYQGLCLF